jgi:hypothetical protein
VGAQLEAAAQPSAYLPTQGTVPLSLLRRLSVPASQAGTQLAYSVRAMVVGDGQVTSPAVTGTGVLTTGVAALASTLGVSESVGTSILAAQDRTMAGLGTRRACRRWRR